jgi:signal transduction histidine kinase
MEALRDAPEGRIGLLARQETGGHVVLAVRDNGPGIPPDQREKVFVPFYTTKRQGSGVGLSLVRQIVAVHNGSVVIGDARGGGAMITLRL